MNSFVYSPLLFLSLLVPMCFSSCTSPPQPAVCSAETCPTGCCQGGVCLTAATPAFCGAAGAVCISCGMRSCVQGMCVIETAPVDKDAGETEVDAGPLTPAMDAGRSDGGVDCAIISLDPKLGTLVAEPGVVVQEAAALPPGIVDVAAAGARLYGVSRSTVSIHRLGTFPDVTLGDRLTDIVSPADRANDAGVFISGGLAVTETRAVAGSTTAAPGYPGNVVVVSTADLTSPASWITAPGNYAFASLFGTSTVLVNGLGLGAFSETATYALEVSAPSRASKLASFDAPNAAASGPITTLPNGSAVIGYYDAEDFKNHLVVVPPDAVQMALSSTTPFLLSAYGDAYAGEDVFATASAGNSLVVLRGTYEPPTFSGVTKDVIGVPLKLQESSVKPAPLQRLLSTKNRCTSVLFLASFGNDFLMGVSDRTGRRLLRITPPNEVLP